MGKDEKGVEPAGAPNGVAIGVDSAGVSRGVGGFGEEEDSPGVGSFPIFFSQPRIAGSLLLTHVISIPFMSTRDDEDVEEAVTDAYASEMFLKGTSAVACVGVDSEMS